MSHLSRIIAGLVLLGLVSVPAFTSAQLLDRNRLKPPLLRLPNLGQRQAKKNNKQPAQAHGHKVAEQVTIVPGSTTSVPAVPVPAAGIAPAPVPATIAPQPPVAGAPTAPLAVAVLPPASPPVTAPQPVGLVQGPVALTQPMPTPTAQPIAGAPSVATPQPAPTAVPVQPLSEAVPQQPAQRPVEKTATSNTQVPQISTAQKTMNLALDDAQGSLDHMRANVRDYTCEFIKRERVKGTLVPTETAVLKIRNRVTQNGRVVVPLSVYMKFSTPVSMKGREVLFIEGQNKEKIHVKEGGMRGRLLPAMWLAQDSMFAMSSNRYPISQIGMIRLAERLIESGRATPMDGCNVKYIHGAKVDSRTCSYLEIVRPTPRPGLEVGHNNVNYAQIFIDSQLKMPIRFVAYDWPAQPGGKPRLIEQYTYRNIKVNVGLKDVDFSPKNPKYNF